jgi:transcriptional regulator with XRE-family HTH domain
MPGTNRQLAKRQIDDYQQWRDQNLSGDGWFPIFPGFAQKHLAALSGGAVKLYVYLGVNGSRTGESWHSIPTIARYFGKSSRTVNEWIKELSDAGLIIRYQLKHDGEAHTYLCRYETECSDSLGRRIRIARNRCGLSIEGLSRRSGLGVQVISRLESNAVPNPHAKVLQTLATALGVTTDFIRGIAPLDVPAQNRIAAPTRPETRPQPRRAEDFGGLPY